MSSGGFNLLPHVVVNIDVEYIRHEIEGVLVVLNFGVETRQVESVREILFVNLNLGKCWFNLFQMARCSLV